MRASLAMLAALVLAGCEIKGDQVQEAGDGCTLMITYAPRCQNAIKAAVCYTPRAELVRRTTSECVR